jgi:protein-S-isoprenylcysteine O-methyltransferase Ste14
MAVSVAVKLVVLVVMVFSGVAVMFRYEPVIRSLPASLFCGAEVLIGLAILYWVWRDFGQPPRAEAGAVPDRGG